MPMRAIVMSLVALSLVMLALPYAATADCGDRIVLSSTADGDAVAASGIAYVGSDEASMTQTFSVRVIAAVSDGTELLVFANGLQAGTVAIVGGMGRLGLSAAHRALPGGVDPGRHIRPIWGTAARPT